jgi:hypothetical protein
MAEQNYANHRKFVPAYHYVATSILTLNLGWSLYRLANGLPGVPFFDRLLAVLVAAALIIVLLYARLFPLRAQDRVIRLEERMRLEALLPADLRPRIGELRPGQLVALRFASDEELPELTRRVLDGQLRTSSDIKKAVRNWRGDYLRV